MDTATLVPREGLIVRDPQTGNPLDPEGEEKPLSPYWLRRLADGDAAKKKKTTTRRAAPSREED